MNGLFVAGVPVWLFSGSEPRTMQTMLSCRIMQTEASASMVLTEMHKFSHGSSLLAWDVRGLHAWPVGIMG